MRNIKNILLICAMALSVSFGPGTSGVGSESVQSRGSVPVQGSRSQLLSPQDINVSRYYNTTYNRARQNGQGFMVKNLLNLRWSVVGFALLKSLKARLLASLGVIGVNPYRSLSYNLQSKAFLKYILRYINPEDPDLEACLESDVDFIQKFIQKFICNADPNSTLQSNLEPALDFFLDQQDSYLNPDLRSYLKSVLMSILQNVLNFTLDSTVEFDLKSDLKVILDSIKKSNLGSIKKPSPQSNLKSMLEPILEYILKSDLKSDLKPDLKPVLNSSLKSNLKSIFTDLDSILDPDVSSFLKFYLGSGLSSYALNFILNSSLDSILKSSLNQSFDKILNAILYDIETIKSIIIKGQIPYVFYTDNSPININKIISTKVESRKADGSIISVLDAISKALFSNDNENKLVRYPLGVKLNDDGCLSTISVIPRSMGRMIPFNSLPSEIANLANLFKSIKNPTFSSVIMLTYLKDGTLLVTDFYSAYGLPNHSSPKP